MATDEQVQGFLKNPANFLYSVDWRGGVFHFVPASREALSTLPFLDNRTLGTSQKRGTLPLDQVINLARENSGSCDFIFHSAFCCSTLLARCLDRPGHALALKEPFAILNLSGLKRASEIESQGNEFGVLCQATLGLLARPFNSGERTLIKPSNGANNLLPFLLLEPGCGKVLLLFGPLEDFLVAVITGGENRQAFIDGILKLFIKDFGGDLDIKEVGALAPLERAALVWGLQVRLFSETAKSADKGKVATLNYRVFLDDKAKTLNALNGFFGYRVSDQEIQRTLNGPLFKTHAKELQNSFNPKEREAEKQSVLLDFKTEIKEAKSFSKALGLEFSERTPVSLL